MERRSMSEQTATEVVAENIQLDESRQGKAKAYASISRRLMLVDLVFGAVYVLLWLLTPLNLAARDWVMSFTTNPWLTVILYGAVFGIPYIILNLPLSYYSGFVLPHQYDQSTQTLSGWVMD